MKKYISTLFLISSTIIGAQELDKAFLESLPKNIQEDLEEQAKENAGSEDPIYRSIENQTKLEKKRLEDLKKRLEADLALLEEKLKEDEDNVKNKDDLKKLLIEQIESRVRWRESVINMISKGIKQFVEIGPGKVLSGLVKRIDRRIEINTINDENDIKNLKI